jgi:LPS sulfotransferase NodH
MRFIDENFHATFHYLNAKAILAPYIFAIIGQCNQRPDMSEPENHRKGLIILSMPRSGSSWLAALTNASGSMGVADEWLDYAHLAPPKGAKGRPLLNEKTLQAASTENGNFAVKIFPRQLLQVIDEYEFDFIRRAYREHNVQLVFLERTDRKAQAISLVRAMQTGQWHGGQTARKTPRYNFGALAQAYFHISRGYDFWRSYLALQGFPYLHFTYEALVKDPMPYLSTVCTHFEQGLPSGETALEIQSDDQSIDWRARFENDLNSYGIPASAFQQSQPEKGLSNALKVLQGKPAKISRFGYSS